MFTDVRLLNNSDHPHPQMLHHESTYMAMRVRRIFKMVHERNEEAGNEASKREQNCTHSKAGEGQPDEGPVPVKAAVRPLEHPVKPNLQHEGFWTRLTLYIIKELSNTYSNKFKTHKNILSSLLFTSLAGVACSSPRQCWRFHVIMISLARWFKPIFQPSAAMKEDNYGQLTSTVSQTNSTIRLTSFGFCLATIR